MEPADFEHELSRRLTALEESAGFTERAAEQISAEVAELNRRVRDLSARLEGLEQRISGISRRIDEQEAGEDGGEAEA